MRGTVGRFVPATNATRKPIASSRASETLPAKLQWIFSKVTQKTRGQEEAVTSAP